MQRFFFVFSRGKESLLWNLWVTSSKREFWDYEPQRDVRCDCLVCRCWRSLSEKISVSLTCDHIVSFWPMCMLTQYTSSVYFWFVLMIVLVSYCRRSSWDSMSIALGSLTLSLLSVLSLPNIKWDSGHGDSNIHISKQYVDVVKMLWPRQCVMKEKRVGR